jgi:hypothetical protein
MQILIVIARAVAAGLVSGLVSAAKTIGAMGGAHTHDLESQRALYHQRDEYRP